MNEEVNLVARSIVAQSRMVLGDPSNFHAKERIWYPFLNGMIETQDVPRY